MYFKDHKNCTPPEVSGGLGRARVWNHSSLLLPPGGSAVARAAALPQHRWAVCVPSREGPPTGPAPPHSRTQVPGEEGASGTHLRPPGPPGSHRAYLGDPARACRWRAWKRHRCATPTRPASALAPGSPAHIRVPPPPVTWRLTKVSADHIPRGPE